MSEQLIRLFGKEIQKNLFPENEFYKNSRLDGGIEPQARTIDVPQSGALPGVVVNPNVFPLQISQRTDDTLQYDVSLLATLPIHITDFNLYEINYDKRKDILEDHVSILNTRAAELIGYSWATGIPAANIIRTTGTGRASAFGGANKKRVTYQDIVKLDELLNRQNVPMMDRCLLVPATMLGDLLAIEEFISSDYTMKKGVVNDGSIGTILRFKVYVRSMGINFDDTGLLTREPVYDPVSGLLVNPAADTNESILAWHQMYVRRAEGNVKVYAETDRPEFIGSYYNAAVRVGGTRGRADNVGVVALVQEDV